MVKRKPRRGPKAIALLKLSPDGGHLAEFKRSIVDSNAALLTLSRTCRIRAKERCYAGCGSSLLRSIATAHFKATVLLKVSEHQSAYARFRSSGFWCGQCRSLLWKNSQNLALPGT